MALASSACSGGGGSGDTSSGGPTTTDPIDQPATQVAGERPVQVTGAGNVRLGGTLSIPAAAVQGGRAGVKVPAVLFVPDLAPSDRDGLAPTGGVPDHLAAELSASFTEAGMATFRYDGRGTGQSKLEADKRLSFADLVADAKAGVDFLAQRKETAGSKLAVVGYDEGGLVALRLAATDPRVTRVLLISMPGRPVVDAQADELAASYGPDSAAGLRQAVAGMLATGRLPPLADLRSELRPLLPPQEIPLLTELYGLDPAAEAAKVKVPVLVVVGSGSKGVSRLDADRLAQAVGPSAEVVMADNAGASLLNVLPPPAVDPSDPNSSAHEHGAAPPAATGARDPATVDRIRSWLGSGLATRP
jgi:pimeloyl-ACP methyl ester carboxylesterase